MTTFAHLPVRTASPGRQAGASLLFALITLVALALAATALVRSVDTGAIVLGNLGSKKATAIASSTSPSFEPMRSSPVSRRTR